jgi:hypothetical protein
MKTIFNITLFLFCGLGFCFAQTGRITGKLILEDAGETQTVAEKTTVTLVDGTIKRSIAIDKSLSFHFDSITNDSVRLYISPRSYPVDLIYIIHLKRGFTENIELPYSPTCKYLKSINNKNCPNCNKQDKVIPILYGLIAETGKNKKKYKAGGCVVSDCQPNWFCERDKLEF